MISNRVQDLVEFLIESKVIESQHALYVLDEFVAIPQKHRVLGLVALVVIIGQLGEYRLDLIQKISRL